MTNYSFNLIDREWIWAVWYADNRREPISLYDALIHAHELREIHGDTPPETVALHRLLLTMLYRVFDPNEDWGNLWSAGQFDITRLDAYLRSESIYARFNLFEAQHPFFQLAQESPAWTKYKLVSVSNLRPHYAAGNDAVLFDHRNKDARLGIEVEDKDVGTILNAAEAARALVAQQAFGFAGLNDPGAPNKADKSFSNAPCARGVAFLLEGDSLFETLLLNFFSLDLQSRHGLKPIRIDKPAWELDDPFKDDPKRPYGYLDYATWLNRKVLLLPEGDPEAPVVRRMRYYVGMKRMNGNPFNPLMSLHPNPNAGKKRLGSTEETSTHLPLTFQTSKSLWRDSAPLFGWLQEREQGYIAPKAFEWIHNELPIITGPIEDNRQFFFSAYGICSKSGQDKMYFFRAERFPLPQVYLQEAGLDASKQLKLALQRAESTARILSLYGALGTFACLVLGIKEADKLREGNKKRVSDFVEAMGAERYFWSRLEANFARLVEDLPTQVEEAVKTWDATLKQLARQGFEEAARVAGGMRALRAYGIAANRFEIDLSKVFESPSEQKEEDKKSSRTESTRRSAQNDSQLSMFNG